MQTWGRVLNVVLGCSVLVTPLMGPQREDAPGGKSEAQQIIFDATNRERLSRGLSRLQWNDHLAEAAQQHAQRMAKESAISHQFPGEPPLQTRISKAGGKFSEAAENVAEGPDATVIQAEWMHSEHHRENLLSPGLNSIGIGVAERGGQLFAVEDFSDEVPVLSVEQQEEAARGRLKELGLLLTDRTEDARKDCAMARGYTGNPPARFKLRYTTTDPKQLPEMLEEKIQSGQYRAAAVGACASADQSGSTDYRLSVLLY
jgi:hypothetical protein